MNFDQLIEAEQLAAKVAAISKKWGLIKEIARFL